MHQIWPLLPFTIVLAFCWVVYSACRSWPAMGLKGRLATLLLLAPVFLLVGCIVVSLLYGHPPQGSHGFNIQFVCGVLVLFILPLPALAGTIVALGMFRRARSGS